MPRTLSVAIVVLAVLALVPPALIALTRSTTTDRPRIHLIPDMDSQPKFKTQAANGMFEDRRAMRPALEGTVPRGSTGATTPLVTGKDGDTFVTTFPIPVTDAVMLRGEDRFSIYCAPCHGLDGAGVGMVHERAMTLQEGTWIPPTSLHFDSIRKQPHGHFYDLITNGIRNMPSYASQLSVEDRWAVVAYVRALQRSQNATLDDVPLEARADLESKPTP